MQNSPTISKIIPAFLKAQKKIEAVQKTSSNPYFKSKYADLTAVLSACKDALNSEGLAILQPVGKDEHGHFVETLLWHDSGEFISEKLHLVNCEQDMQKLGAAISYARRYGLQSMIALPAEDDDGNAGSGHNVNPKKLLDLAQALPADRRAAATAQIEKASGDPIQLAKIEKHIIQIIEGK